MNEVSLEWNAYQQNCPTRAVLNRIADKWTMLVLGLLTEQPMRFNQLRRSIEGISQKMLTQTLRQLERDGLVDRAASSGTPPAVEYSITPLGGTLASVVEGVRNWAREHILEVLEAQAAFDREHVKRNL